jgi:hypothetical protein
MTKGVSEDAVRGNFSKIDDAKGVLGMPQHLDAVTLPILSAPWMAR